MTDLKEVPAPILSLLSAHLKSDYCSQEFLRGFLSLLDYQYPESLLSAFYDNHALKLDFYSKLLPDFINKNSGNSEPSSSKPV